MSQIAKLFDGTASKDLETLTGDVGGAVGVDAALNINLLTGDGLTATGTPLTNTITFTLDNFSAASAQTIGAVTADIITLNLGAVAGMRIAEAKVVGFEATGPSGCAYNLICGARTSGAATTIVSLQDKYVAEDAALNTGDVNFVAVGNTLIVRVIGVAALTINWKATLTYVGA